MRGRRSVGVGVERCHGSNFTNLVRVLIRYRYSTGYQFHMYHSLCDKLRARGLGGGRKKCVLVLRIRWQLKIWAAGWWYGK